MSLIAYSDHNTHTLLEDAIDELAHRRELDLNRGPHLLSIIASIARQLEETIEDAIANTDIGYDLTIEDIADLLHISTTEARNRYQN